VRLLALADQPPPADPAELVASNAPEAVVTLGDLEPAWIASLAALELPRLGVHGNHDSERDLAELGIRDLHLDRVELDGWRFSGFEGCVRYRDGPYQYTQEQAVELARRLPAAEVLLCHCPPLGVNDDPDDPAHQGFQALRDWIEEHRPRYLLHGHTTPDPRRRTRRLGDTEVVWVRGATVVQLER
jgi:Icc-related predicted phosphoesterase